MLKTLATKVSELRGESVWVSNFARTFALFLANDKWNPLTCFSCTITVALAFYNASHSQTHSYATLEIVPRSHFFRVRVRCVPTYCETLSAEQHSNLVSDSRATEAPLPVCFVPVRLFRPPSPPASLRAPLWFLQPRAAAANAHVHNITRSRSLIVGPRAAGHPWGRCLQAIWYLGASRELQTSFNEHDALHLVMQTVQFFVTCNKANKHILFCKQHHVIQMSVSCTVVYFMYLLGKGVANITIDSFNC